MTTKLYKKTSTGAVQEWWQECANGQYRTHCGQVGGATVTSAWTQAASKNVGQANATSPQEQALSEVESHYARKRKDGYMDSQEAALASERFTPMLAKEYSKYEAKLDFKKGIYCQPKLDGIRCIANVDGLWSRKGDRITTLKHIEDALAPIFAAQPDLILDGEAYRHDLAENFNELVSQVKKSREETADSSGSAGMQYYVYDMVSSEPFSLRCQKVYEICRQVGEPLVCVPTHNVHSKLELQGYYEEFLNALYEGQMVRINGPYEMKRSGLLLKRKEFVDSEFLVVDILEGRGNAAGGAKIAVLQLDTDPSVTFKADILGSIAERKAFLKDKANLLGIQATVKYFAQRTPAGIPRFGKVKQFWKGGKV